MKIEPLISIIIACYNYEQFIASAIESAISQTYKNTEIIVIDDGSTDNSLAIISKYSEYIKIISRHNKGYAKSLNEGFSASLGEIIFFVDADDQLLPNALCTVVDYWSDDLAKVQFDLDVIDANSISLNRRQCNFMEDISPEQTAKTFALLGTYRWPVTTGNAYSRSFLIKVMPLTPPIGHDGVLNTIAPLYGGISTIGKVLGRYRLHNRNLSRKDANGHSRLYPDFGRAIEIRHAEIEILRSHANRLSISIPSINIIDNEAVFLSYKIMFKSTEYRFDHDNVESRSKLWLKLFLALYKTEKSKKILVLQLVWNTAVLISPRYIGKFMVSHRYSRGRAFSFFSKK